MRANLPAPSPSPNNSIPQRQGSMYASREGSGGGLTALGFTIESRRVVTMGLLPPKIQCSALATAASAASDKRLANIMFEL